MFSSLSNTKLPNIYADEGNKNNNVMINQI